MARINEAEKIFDLVLKRRQVRRSVVMLAVLFCATMMVLVFSEAQNRYVKTIGFVQLKIINSDNSLTEDGDMLIKAVQEKLSLINGISIVRFKPAIEYGNPLMISERRSKGPDFLIGSIIRQEGDKTVIRLELSETLTNGPLWSERYILEKDQVPFICSEAVRMITVNLGIVLSDEELTLIDEDIRYYK